jgi:glucitol operon activator protein
MGQEILSGRGGGKGEALMAFWQIALIVLVAAWAVQSIGVWLQMQHYQRTFKAMRSRWSDGAMGAGAAPGRLGKGVIALVVVAPDGTVRKVSAMEGRSVFAKLRDRPEYEGLPMRELKARADSGQLDAGLARAILKAIEQIESIVEPANDSKPRLMTA